MADHGSDLCLNDSVDENHSFLDMELEALQSIYINELEVNVDETCTTVSIDLHPSTADNLDEQYVRMTLQFILEDEYPEKIPDIKIKNPRGLSDEKLNGIIKDLLTIAESKKGNSMLFEMIDAAKEHLTIGNRPSGKCAICLYKFSDNDVFTKTECYHYFHSHCLARYTKNFIENSTDYETDAKSKSISNELLCPMCRIPIQFNAFDVHYPPPEESGENDFVVTEEIVELQKKMADMYQKQVEKGGIIDVEAEKNKYLLEISNVPTRVNNEEKLEQKSVTEEEGNSVTDSKVETSDEVDSPVSERKEYPRDQNQKFNYRGKNRNFNRPHDNRNYRYDYRYNKQSYDNYRGNYNKSRFGKHNYGNSYRYREDSEMSRDRPKDSSIPQDLPKNEDVTSSQDIPDDVSETSEQPSPVSKNRHSSNFSPKYNRGYRYGGNNYGNYHNGRRSDKSNYQERHNSQATRRDSAMRGEDPSPSKFKEGDEEDLGSFDDGNYKANRSGNFKHNDYYTKQRYSDNRNNSQQEFKGAYGRKDHYSVPHSNYSRNSRYGDSRDREQYSDRNYKERRTYRDDRYRNSGDGTYDRYKQGSRNYTGSRPGRYSDKSYAESSNNESESVELSTRSQNSDSNALLVESENLGDSKSDPNSFERKNGSVQKEEATNFDEKCSDKLTDVVPTIDGSASNNFPSVRCENSQVIPRTVNPPPGFANPFKKVIYGLQGANPPPGFNRS